MTAADVAVIGAGPTGLTLATLLGRAGLRVVVLERHRGVHPLPRAVRLDDEVYRILLQAGIGAGLAAVTRPALGLRLVDERHRELATFAREPRTPAGIPQAAMFDQPDVERLLREALAGQPSVELREGCEVTAVRDGVCSLADGEQLRASYIVGCDGANSSVRRSLGIGLRDLGFEQRWLVVDVRCDTALPAWDGVHQVCDPHRAGTYMRVGETRYRWEFRLLGDETAADFADPDRLHDLIGAWTDDRRLDVLRRTDYTFRARVARRWRSGRVFLAGDAAHTTPPFIGQGLCAGQRDAANLAWKLTAAVRGRADPGLLASYEAERKPHATGIIRQAVLLGRTMTSGGRAAGLLRRHLVPALAGLPAVRRTVLDSRTAPLVPGPLVDRRTPRRVRGALLPLVDVGGILVDRLLGDRPAVVALPGVDPALVPCPGRWLTVAPEDGPGERVLAHWLTRAGVDWVRVDPDRVVRTGGRAGLGTAH